MLHVPWRDGTTPYLVSEAISCRFAQRSHRASCCAFWRSSRHGSHRDGGRPIAGRGKVAQQSGQVIEAAARNSTIHHAKPGRGILCGLVQPRSFHGPDSGTLPLPSRPYYPELAGEK